MKISTFVSVLLYCGVAGPGGGFAFGAPLQIGGERQLFVDRTFLADARDVSLVVHPPRKSGEQTVRPDRPWERGGIGPYSSVLHDGTTYHMWYHAMDSKQWDTGHRNGSICYAISEDGVEWRKPEVGLVEYQGSRANNIVFGHGANGVVLGQDGGMVFLDPTAPRAERFRMVARFGPEGSGVRILSSGDGIHWRLTHPSVITAWPQEKGSQLDSQNVIFWDDARMKYVAYVRYNRPEVRGRARSISRSESDRLGGFPVVQDMPVVLQPDEHDLRENDLPAVDFYVSAAIKYPWAGDAYFMFPTAFSPARAWAQLRTSRASVGSFHGGMVSRRSGRPMPAASLPRRPSSSRAANSC